MGVGWLVWIPAFAGMTSGGWLRLVGVIGGAGLSESFSGRGRALYYLGELEMHLCLRE